MKNILKKQSGIGLISILVLFNFVIISCSKTDMKQTDPSFEASQANSGKAEREDGDVATDWYRLHFSILKERNSSFNGIFYAYFGVALWESVRPGVRNSQSFLWQNQDNAHDATARKKPGVTIMWSVPMLSWLI
jgi:hypothetical protein